MTLPTASRRRIAERILFSVRLLGQALVPGKLRIRLRRYSLYGSLVDFLPWEADVLAVLRGVVKPGWTVIDVGGHVGRFTTEFGRMVGPTGLVIVFEPHPDNVQLIRQRVAKGRLNNRVKVVQAAVSNGDTATTTLYQGPNATSAEWNIIGSNVAGRNNQEHLETPATSLDSYIGPDQPVHLVKIDIEGAEHLALQGMARMLTRQRPFVFAEFHPQTNYRMCCDILLSAGYGLFTLDGNEAPLFPAAAATHALAKPDSDFPSHNR